MGTSQYRREEFKSQIENEEAYTNIDIINNTIKRSGL